MVRVLYYYRVVAADVMIWFKTLKRTISDILNNKENLFMNKYTYIINSKYNKFKNISLIPKL